MQATSSAPPHGGRKQWPFLLTVANMQRLPSAMQLTLGCTGHVTLLVVGLVLALIGLSVLFRPSQWDADGTMHPCVTVVVVLGVAITGVVMVVVQLQNGLSC
ncbi:hypothetical protein ACIPSA_47400 [Streptomyces sp. NPDC086549]|uniref:hypothetical protein n=1 Tax=Streptomyces sp. NPDC086549 TaxID=3365752 RepID=UPI0037F76AFD